MEVKPGYKQTEVGVIAQEWETTTLGELGSTYGGLTGKTKADFGEGAARYITFMNVMSNVVIDCGAFDRVKVSPTESQNRATKGDLFFNGSSETPEEVAMCAVLLNEVHEVYLNSFCFGFRFRDGAEADGLFLAYYLRSREGRELMKSLAQGSTRYNLSKVALLKSPLRLPRLPEQRAIAEALSDVDGLLGGLDRLIAKKRDLKQAAMQQLLTGQTRLPGFQGEWEVKALEDAALISMGQSPDSKNYNRTGDGVPLIQGNADIEDRRSIARVWTTQITKEGRTGDLLLTVRAPVGAVGRITERCCLGRGVCSLRAYEDADLLFHALVYAEPAWKVLEQGSTFTSANSTQVSVFSLSMPADPTEQTAIAQVLTEMDAELAALERRREKTRDLKRAMMQELLTGRIRLI